MAMIPVGRNDLRAINDAESLAINYHDEDARELARISELARRIRLAVETEDRLDAERAARNARARERGSACAVQPPTPRSYPSLDHLSPNEQVLEMARRLGVDIPRMPFEPDTERDDEPF